MSAAHRQAGARADVKVGFSCNNRCRFCVQGDKRNRFADRGGAEIRAILAEARESADSLVLTGGEPLTRRDVTAIVREARRLGFSTVQAQTNGRMLAYAKFCGELAEAGVNEISPALHGHAPELHDWLTRAAGSFEQTVAGIRNAKALGLKVITNTVVTRPNYRHLPEIAGLLVSLGVDQFQLAFVHPAGEAAANFTSIVPRLSLAAPYMKKGLDIGLRAGVRVMTEAVPYCILPGYEKFAAERIIPATAIWDADTFIRDYRKYRLDEGKLKGPHCAGCSFDEVCEGPWREYPERYGFDELVPRKDSWRKSLT